jgi:16S rRNA (cytosine1402-N4)-methyltransferase
VNANSELGKGHVPVLLGQVIDGLAVKPAGQYIDGTFGRGGHSREILALLGAGGSLLAIDRDPQAVAEGLETLGDDPRFEIVKGEFARIEKIAAERDLLGRVDGLLLDLGVSSPQLDEPLRGFSFSADGPLDMRMDPESGISAADWLAKVDERELRQVLYRFGEEKNAPKIAHAILGARALQPILRTAQLAEIIGEAAPGRHGQRIHPATRSFQAIRIFINEELQQLEAALQSSLPLLRAGGRLCVMSFHSLEDRIAKRFIRDASRVAEPYRGMPDIPLEYQPLLSPVGRVIKAGESEIEANPRARSVRLRIAEKLR